MERPDLLSLARLGALAGLQILQSEMDGIYRQFPDLRSNAQTQTESPGAKRTRRRLRPRKVSAAALQAVSDRMKKYWAARRKGKTG